MLSNAYFLAKFRFDTAENEPAKKLQKFAKDLRADGRAPRARPPGEGASAAGMRRRRPARCSAVAG